MSVSAAMTISVAGGSAQPFPTSGAIAVPPGSVVVLGLQTVDPRTQGVTYQLRAPGTVLDGQELRGLGPSFTATLGLPITPMQIAITAVVSDGNNSFSSTAVIDSTVTEWPSTDPANAVATWYVDPANVTGIASDSNTGTSQTAGPGGVGPLRTLAQIAERYGTWAPILNGPVSIVLLSDNTVADPLLFTPNCIDSATSGGAMTVTGSIVQLGSATIGTFTARNRSGGTPNEITASGKSGAFWTPFVGALVHDTTANAWFWVDADLGSATARITEPVTSAVGASATAPTYVTIANGDSLIMYRPTNLVAPTLAETPSFGYAFAGGSFVGLTLQHVALIGNLMNVPGPAFNITLNECSIQVGVQAQASVTAVNCFISLAAGGNWQGPITAICGSLQGINTFSSAIYHNSVLDGDVLITGHTHFYGLVVLGRVGWLTGAVLKNNTEPSVTVIFQQFYADAELWGGGSFDLANGSQLLLSAANTQMLLTGGFTLDGGTATGQAGNPTGSSVSITGANVVSNSAIWSPTSGSRYQVFVQAF